MEAHTIAELDDVRQFIGLFGHAIGKVGRDRARAFVLVLVELAEDRRVHVGYRPHDRQVRIKGVLHRRVEVVGAKHAAARYHRRDGW